MFFIKQFYKFSNILSICTLLVFTLCLCRAEAQITVNATLGTASASYTSFNAAIAAVNAGTHKGSIRLRVHANVVETTSTSLEASGVSGSSYTAILITPADTATVMKTISISTTGVTLFTLNGADNVTIDGRPNTTGSSNLLTFNNPNNIASSHSIALTNAATRNTLQYCTISSGSIGTILCSALRLTTGANNGNDINHCIIDGGNLGIEINGTNGTPNDSTNIFANRIINQKATAIRLSAGVGRTVIDSNLVYHTIATTTGGYQCYNISQVETTDTVFIYRTRAYDMQTGAGNFIHGIFLSPSVACGTILAVNNSFVLASATYPNTLSQVIRGVLFTGSLTANLILEHNTFRVGGTHVTANGNPTSVGVYKANTSTASVFTCLNNLFINTRTGSNNQHLGIYMASPTTGTNTIDYNTYYGGPSNKAMWASTMYNDLAAYKTAATPNEQNSVFSTVDFLNEKDPNIDGASTNSTIQNLAGNPGTVTTDILGNTRNAIRPTRGAIEVSYNSGSLPTTFVKVAAQQKGAAIEVSFNTANETNMHSYEVEESKDGRSFTQGTKLEAKNGATNNYSWFDLNVTNGSNYYRVKAIEKNGIVKYSQVVRINIDKQGSEFTVYPNPVKSGIINLQLTNIEKGVYIVKIVNNLGQEIAARVLNHSGGSATQIISIGNAPIGKYNMVITNGITTVTKMVIVE